MGFREIAAADIDFILGGDFQSSEGIEYQSVTAEGPRPWKAISHVIIDTGDPANPFDLGSTGRRLVPIIVQIPKDPTTGIEEIHLREDRIKLHPGTTDEILYLVNAIFDPWDPAMWRLHAVP